MSQTLPLISDEELVRRLPSSLGAASPGCGTDDEPGFGALRTTRGHLPLESMDVRGRIDGLLARVTVRQTFVNALDEPLEAAYIFPLPDRAAVTRFRMEVAGRLIEGVLEERGQAREEYERAIAQGRRAAIAEEDRPGVFNLRVGNLMPGERATVELTLCGVLPYADGEATFRFPLVIAPRYIPGIPLPGPSVGDGTAVDTRDVPDASRISPPVLLPGFPNPVWLNLEVELHDGGAEIEDVRCSLHAVHEEPHDGYRRIRLYAGERLNRDFILRFRLGGAAIRSTLTLHPDPADGQQGTFALTVVPPVAQGDSPTRPRDVVFVLDRSGSMEGWKIVAARRALARMIDTLTDADRFGVLAFDTVLETPPSLPAGLSSATDRSRFRAVEYLAIVGARGGTEMAGPLDRAVTLLADSRDPNRDRILVLITDGQVGNEDQILQTLGQRLKGIRVFTLGIDRAVNEGFLRRLADRGGGSCELVESEDRLDEVLTAVHRRIGTPLLTGLSVNGDDLAIEPGEIVPRRLPDLFAGSPLLILGRYRGRPAGALTIRAAGADGRAWSQPVPAQVRDNPAIAAAWARGQVRQLEDRYAARDGDRSQLEKAIVAVSLKFQVLCRFTAYVAVDRSRAVNPGGTLHRITQPVEQPEGWADMSLMTLSAPGAALAVPDWALPKRRTSGIRGSAKARGLLPAPPPEDSTLLSRDAAAPASFSPGAIRREAPLQASDDEATRATPPGSSDSGVTRLLGTPAYLAPERVRATPHKGLSDRFDVLGRIGSGAMGQIFKAFERQGGRLVIVSVTAATGLGTVALARWRKLKEILGRLRHPAIVPILEVDTSEEMVRIVTPLVEGRTLEERLRLSGRMDPREAAALVAELAEALQLAHQQGLIHGDVTPSNILLGDDGHPRLLGFGATPPGSSDSGVTRLLGTPAYLAPERVRARPAPADALSDVYSLGVVLYEILTGQPPFRGASVAKLLPQILEQAPTPPRQVVRSIPAELETICLKAMAKNPAQRYQTAGELAAALGEFLKPRRRQGFWK